MKALKDQKYIIERLTALWALNESGLGGFMHALSLSFTGILVGGISIISISLIAYFSKSIFKDVIKALTIVLLIKLAVSPHSPLTAYVAVMFQALSGILLFTLFSFNKITYIIFGIITFTESAIQKILVLTLIYGISFWDAINIYGKWVTDALSFISNVTASKLVIGTFIFVYAFLGVLFGFYIYSLIKRINQIELIEKYQLSVEKYQETHLKKKSKQFRRLLFWLVTIALIIISFTQLEDDLFGWGKAFYIIIRSIMVLFIWIFIVSPLLMRLLKFLLKKKKSSYQVEVDRALALFPYLKTIVVFSWKESKNARGIRRISEFVTNCILYSMFFKAE
ncbi:MAG: hypothetical protein GW839_11170 [Flavobacteriales bacterium]|nr:hypothetical protein [Flavobacteriia bacterium]NCP06123.1 hypothetical protein [Flavobacteriales bacterium]PIV93374.1 MAG: hypothetical protein COW44_09785 [Flavobacteriaceae bacterium CG17_big_fil_post_rev_8_21_14_2_50_33_15]PIY12444.1 MAG: hypothetical protein COZ17_03530 [Flavobacteriaceae bacterium CG_4_10_14_3_um_filter_33_47]PJB18765.1 MAG: hypothetical protein CO117_07160 [Flavobacteriaceae bacterium CG_4_9_14_3_um_filter_33_16]